MSIKNFVFLIVFFTILTSCRNETLSNHNDNHVSLSKFTNYTDFISKTKLNFTNDSQSHLSKIQKFILHPFVVENFEIETDSILFTGKQYYQPSTYSFFIKKKVESSTNKNFYNLVFLKKKNGKWIYRILRYEPDAISTPNKFHGKVFGVFDSESANQNSYSSKIACYYDIISVSVNTCSAGHKNLSDCGGNTSCCANCWGISVYSVYKCDQEGLEYPSDGGGIGINPGGGSFDPKLTQITLDNSFINSKSLCVLKKIAGDTQSTNYVTLPRSATNDSFMQKMLRNFNGDNQPNLNFSISASLSNNDWGITQGMNNNYNIVISENIENGSNLMKIITLSHELIHAYMFNYLFSLGIITFDNGGNPILSIQCSTTINYNNVNLNLLTEKERFVALFCAMNQNSNLTPEWTHTIFNSNIFDVETYRQKLESYLLNNINWDGESTTFKNEAISVFGTNWKTELSRAASWIGLENTAEYSSYINSYSTTPSKFIYISQIRHKIQPLNKTCP